MKLSDLQEKDIINIKDGRRIGKIIDAEIDSDGKILYLILDERRGLKGIFSSSNGLNITFNQIKRIGEDVILVDL